jgi:hypothetical protein
MGENRVGASFGQTWLTKSYFSLFLPPLHGEGRYGVIFASSAFAAWAGVALS